MTENKDTRKISELRGWDKNPRAIKKQDFERLKKQIQELGQYKPLLITPDGEVLGGNMRLEAYKALGIDDVWVSVVTPKSEAEKVKYALSDNDRAGYYVEEELAELVLSVPEIELGDYKIDLGSLTDIQDLINQFSADTYGEEFSLPDGEKSGFQQITFTLADEQAELIKSCISDAKGLNLETYDNENGNGNAIYWICKQWQQQRK